jgi:hypothetical protein
VILSEPDPGRRRALAGLVRLPRPVVDHLLTDPDAGVRARIANREDLTDDTVARFVDPTRETSPVVWRSFAATRIGAAQAAALFATGDRLTRLVLAANPATPVDSLGRLARLADPEISSTVAATRAGRPPDDRVIAQVLGARAIATRPVAEAPPGTPWPGGPTSRSATTSPADHAAVAAVDEPASHRGLVIGFVIAAALVVAAVAVIARGGGAGNGVATTPSGADSVAAVPGVSTPAPSTAPATAASASTTLRAAKGGDSGGEAVVLDLTMTAQAERFCGTADITISFNGPTAYVAITDDAGRELWTGSWRSGSTRKIDLIAPSTTLHARLTTTTVPAELRPSGSVKGTFC